MQNTCWMLSNGAYRNNSYRVVT